MRPCALLDYVDLRAHGMRSYKEFSRSLFVDLRAHGMRPYINFSRSLFVDLRGARNAPLHIGHGGLRIVYCEIMLRYAICTNFSLTGY